MRNNPLSGAMYFLRGLSLIGRARLRRFVVVPLLFNIFFFALLIAIGVGWVDSALDNVLPSWLSWLEWLLIPLFVIAIVLVGFFTFNLLANIILAPFNSVLAEAVERYLTGQSLQQIGGFKNMMRDLGKTIGSEFRKLTYILIRTLPLAVLTFLPIPGVNFLASIAWMLLSAWMMAIAYLDYPMGNHGLTFPEQRRRLGEKRWLGIGFGGMVTVTLAIPVVNFVVIPCAVAGATALWVEQINHSKPLAPSSDAPPKVTDDSASPDRLT